MSISETKLAYSVEETVSPASTQSYTSGVGDVKFTCEFTATRAVSAKTIVWYRNGNELMENEAGAMAVRI